MSEVIWLEKGDTMIGYQKIPERKKPVFGIMEGNCFTGYGQFHDEEAAEKFMLKMADFFEVKRVEWRD